MMPFYQSLHDLLSAGLPLNTALRLQLQQNHQKPSKGDILQIISHIEQGQTLTEGLKQIKHMPDTHLMIFRICEQTGDLITGLALLIEKLSSEKKWRHLLIEISFYPLLLFSTSVLLFVVMMLFVIPEFAALYQTLNVDMPSSTQALLNTAQFMQQQLPLFLLCMTCLILVLLSSWRTPPGRGAIEKFLLRIPFIKHVMKNHFEYQFSLHMSHLLRAGCPLIDALDLLAQHTKSQSYQQYLRATIQRIHQGSPLCMAISHGLLHRPAFSRLIEQAEHTGKLDELLTKLSLQYHQHFKQRQQNVKHLLQPIMTLLIGLTLGAWILFLYYPMLQLGTNIG